jgi:hypothetical protein
MHEQFPAYSAQTTIERYNDHLDIWEVITTFPEKRRGCAVAAVGDRIYVFGGGATDLNKCATWDYFDVTTCTWGSALLPAPAPLDVLMEGVASLSMALPVPPSSPTPSTPPVAPQGHGPWEWAGRKGAIFSLAVGFNTANWSCS